MNTPAPIMLATTKNMADHRPNGRFGGRVEGVLSAKVSAYVTVGSLRAGVNLCPLFYVFRNTKIR